MKAGTPLYSWIDLLTLVVLIVGIIRGRKRGLSEELLDTMQWIAIVVVGGIYYQAVAAAIGWSSVLGPTFFRILAYILIAVGIKLVFLLVKRRIGEKIVGSDLFGWSEYYLGMVAGMVRFACVYLFLLNLLHAPYYTEEMLLANERYQDKNFGDIRFPTIGSMQKEVFKNSLTGRSLEQHLPELLLQPVPSAPLDLRGENSLAKRRERSIDAMIGGK